MKKKLSVFNTLTLAIVYIFMYAPLLVMVFFSFNSDNSTFKFAGFSLRWYKELFSRSDILEAFRNTLVLAVCSSVIATVIGTIAAYGIYRVRNKFFQSAMMSVTNIPMMNPDIVTGVSLMLLFVFVGRLMGAQNSLSFFTLLCAHITFNIPYVILNVLPKLRQTDIRLYEAAMDLGCTPGKAFFKVVLPSITPGIISGLLMAFTLSLDDFVISYYTGYGFQTLPIIIESMTRKRVKPDMYALSSIIFVTILLLLVVTNIIQMRGEKKDVKKQKG